MLKAEQHSTMPWPCHTLEIAVVKTVTRLKSHTCDNRIRAQPNYVGKCAGPLSHCAVLCSPSGDEDHAVVSQLCDSGHDGGLLAATLGGSAREHGRSLASLQGFWGRGVQSGGGA